MNHLLGEFDGKLDAKGRLVLPAGLLRQLSPETAQHFVINRGFERNLSLYPYAEWQRVSDRVNRLNLFVQKNRQFARYFYRGATELRLDASNRLLLPRRLLEYAGIESQVVLVCFPSFVELWAEESYGDVFDIEPAAFASLAEEIMGEDRAGKDEEDEID